MKVRDNLEFDREFFEDHEPDWKYVMYWPNKCAFVKVSDAGECDTSLVKGHETHGMLHMSLTHINYPPEVHERCQQYGYIDFMDTVRKTLRLTRIVAFT